MSTSPLLIRYIASVLGYRLDAAGESHCSFCNMAVTLVVRLQSRQVKRAMLRCTASTLVVLRLTVLSHTDKAYFSCGLTSFVALFSDACWTAAEVSVDKVE